MELAKIITEFPHRIREVEHAFIPLADGTRLATRYWLPDDAERNPVPAILEYIPYCKRDGTAARDEAMHPYFAGHGYAAVRVDMRGSGESDGLLHDEYLLQEQDDALEVIAWLAAQPWCDGTVGMMGKSWGGFNGLQVAARRPPALKCVISVYSTDDRYADDVHYMGGCLLADNALWAFVMFGYNARPPDPRLVGDGWRKTWQARLEANRPWLLDWLSHQRRDAYWRHGSVCEDFASIEVPVYAMGGWADSYSNTVAHLVANLTPQCKGLVGPWGHAYMHQAAPGPMLGYMSEALRWWDHWLKGKNNGVTDEPAYRVWTQDSIAPRTSYSHRPGQWIAEDTWPSPRIETLQLALTDEGLRSEAVEGQTFSTRCPQHTGLDNLTWGDGGTGDPQLPGDQREDDARSLCFDTQPLTETLEILGAPTVDLDLHVDQPQAFVGARLSDVAPDGASTRVTFGLLNLTHRNGHETPEPLEPGRRYRVRVTMNDIAHRFAAGHRVRVALSSALWPMVWPSPAVTRLSVHGGASSLMLPTRAPREEDHGLAPMPAAEMSAVEPVTVVRAAEPYSMTVNTDIGTGVVTVHTVEQGAKVRVDRDGWTFGDRSETRQSIHPEDPLSAVIEQNATLEYERSGDCDVRIEIWTKLSADADAFRVQARLEAFESDQSVFERDWDESIPRDGV